jgi:hypothetical protein
MQSVGKARRVGALFGGRRRFGERRDPEVPVFRVRKGLEVRRAGGEPERETLFGWFSEEKAREAESPGEQGPRPELTVRGARRGTAFSVGVSRWSADARPDGFRNKAQERRREEKFSFDHRRGGKLWRAKPKSVGG